MAALGVAVGRFLLPQPGVGRQHLYAMAAAFFVCGFGNVINDLSDIDADRINHPGRPLPSGRLGRREAGFIAVLFAFAATALMFPLNNSGRIIVAGALVLVTWYNRTLKHTAFFGNVAVSLLAAFTFLLGGAERGIGNVLSLPGPAIGAGLALLMHLMREIIKDIEDRTGDATAGGQTAALRFGVGWAMAAVWLAFLLLAAGIVGAYAAGWFNAVYLSSTIILIILPLTVSLTWLGIRPERSRCPVVSTAIKFQMLVGIAALVIGRSY